MTWSRSFRWLAAIACAALGALSTRVAFADDAPSPSWLRAPHATGPVAGTAAIDANRVWWSIDVLPLDIVPGLRAPLDRTRLGLRWSISGDETASARALGYSALLDRRTQRTGQWLGLSTRPSGYAGRLLHLGAGVLYSFKPVQVEAGVVTSFVKTVEERVESWGFFRNTRDTLRWVDTTAFRTVEHAELNTTTHTTLRWQFGRVEIAAVGGMVLGRVGIPRRWAQATVNVRATRQLQVMAAFGQRPNSSLVFEPFAGSRTMLGVRLTPFAPRMPVMTREAPVRVHKWTTRAVQEGRTAVRVRCPNAMRVELTGDFTDWTPIALTALGGGWWGCEMEIAPGLHQVQVRVDAGAWQAPPGLPTTQGAFAGMAGVLVVE
jgi:hypothetical protein